MPSVFESVTGLLGRDNALGRIGQAIGTDEVGADRLVRSSTPALLSGLADRAERPGGSRLVMEMLDEAERSPLGGPDTMFNGDRTLGLGMLNGIFGDDLGRVSNGLADRNGVDSGAIGKLLPILAPIVMGVVARRRAESGLDANGVAGLLRGEREQLGRNGLLATGADPVGIGGARISPEPRDYQAGAAPTVARHRGQVAPPAVLEEPPRRGRGLWWLLAGLAALLFGGWLLSQCSGSDAGDLGAGAVDAVEDAADGAADVGADAVDAAGDAVEGAVDEAEDAADAGVDAVSGDADLTTAVGGALATGGFDGVTAEVADGVVTLTGTAADDAARAGAETAAAQVPGVDSVVNRIELDGDTGADAADADGADADAADADAADADNDGEAMEDGDGEEATAGATINELLDLAPVTFAVNSAELTAEGQAVLDEAVGFLEGNPDVRVEIGGHTDSDGADAANMALSQARAESVEAYLESQGIDGERMDPVGYGESRPVTGNDTPAEKAENRRIEFTIL